jgi:hypothetical protein
MTVVLIVAHNHYNVRAVRDIGADDEGWYLGSGVLLGKAGFPNGPDGWPIPEQGPLYSLWYFALAKIWHVPLDLYFAGWQLLMTALSLGIYAVARRAGSSWWQALLATFFFVNSVVADLWPFPTYFATLLILIGIGAASLSSTIAAQLTIVTVAFAFAGFARPEILVAYGAAVIALVVHAAWEGRRTRQWRRGAITVLAGVTPGLLLCTIFGNPFGGTRAYYAFGQHYTLSLFASRGSPLDPWARWPEVVAIDFPGAWTIAQAARVNPTAFFAHVLRNIREFPRAIMLLSDALGTSRNVEIAVIAVGLSFAVVQLWRSARLVRTNLVVRALWMALACCAVPFSLSCLVVYPRLHYFVPVAVLAGTLAFLSPLPALGRRLSPPLGVVRVAGFCALLVVLTRTKSGATFGEWVTRRPAIDTPFGERQRAIVYLQALALREPLVALEDAWGTCLYAGYARTGYLRFEKNVPFDEFVRKFGINVVIVDETMPQDPHFVDDSEFADFLREPARHGFISTVVPGTHMRVAYRPGLATAPP